MCLALDAADSASADSLVGPSVCLATDRGGETELSRPVSSGSATDPPIRERSGTERFRPLPLSLGERVPSRAGPWRPIGRREADRWPKARPAPNGTRRASGRRERCSAGTAGSGGGRDPAIRRMTGGIGRGRLGRPAGSVSRTWCKVPDAADPAYIKVRICRVAYRSMHSDPVSAQGPSTLRRTSCVMRSFVGCRPRFP